MMLRIRKVSEDLFVAEATPPEVGVAWTTPEPMSARKLLKQLIGVCGAHSIDVADALNEQDPDWIGKAQGPYE